MEHVANRRRRRLWVISGVLALMVAGAAARYALLESDPPVSDNFPKPQSERADRTLLERLRLADLEMAWPPETRGSWPQWRGALRDGRSSEVLPSDPWGPEGPRLSWQSPGGLGHSGIAVAEGRVFTLVQEGADEAVLCLDAATGRVIWKHRSRDRFHETHAGTGPHATPTIAGGRVYTLGATGRLQCLDTETGKVIWGSDLLRVSGQKVPHYGVSSSPLVDGNRVVVMPGIRPSGTVAAYDRNDGTLIWSAGTERPGHSSPVRATLGGITQYVVVTGDSVQGLHPEGGRLLWRYPWDTHLGLNIATPVLVGDYVFVSSAYNRGCVLLEITREPSGSFSVHEVYFHNRMRNHFSSCVLVGEHLYGFDKTFMVCMAFRTGEVTWKQRGFGRGSLLAARDDLIVLGENGRLARVTAHPLDYEEVASFEFSSTRCWAMPSLAEGRLYVRDQEWIKCFDLNVSR